MTFIIAEGGVNHGGDVSQACLLADAAKEAGADVFVSASYIFGIDNTRKAYEELNELTR